MKVKVLIIGCLTIIAVWAYQSFIINVTPSEPLGIYKIHALQNTDLIKRGDVVAVCLSADLEERGLKRHYLISGLRCRKSAPLLKTVIAVPGDAVVLKDDAIIVNGKVFSYVTQLRDSQGRGLTIFPRGTYSPTKKYWLIGTSDLKSWDSRYWGGVDRKNILFKVKRYWFF